MLDRDKEAGRCFAPSFQTVLVLPRFVYAGNIRSPNKPFGTLPFSPSFILMLAGSSGVSGARNPAYFVIAAL